MSLFPSARTRHMLCLTHCHPAKAKAHPPARAGLLTSYSVPTHLLRLVGVLVRMDFLSSFLPWSEKEMSFAPKASKKGVHALDMPSLCHVRKRSCLLQGPCKEEQRPSQLSLAAAWPTARILRTCSNQPQHGPTAPRMRASIQEEQVSAELQRRNA